MKDVRVNFESGVSRNLPRFRHNTTFEAGYDAIKDGYCVEDIYGSGAREFGISTFGGFLTSSKSPSQRIDFGILRRSDNGKRPPRCGSSSCGHWPCCESREGTILPYYCELNLQLLMCAGPRSRPTIETLLGLVLPLCAASLDCTRRKGHRLSIHRSQSIQQAQITPGPESTRSRPDSAVPEQASFREHSAM